MKTAEQSICSPRAFVRPDLLLRVAIVLLALGGLGGSLQPSRLILLASVGPFIGILLSQWKEIHGAERVAIITCFFLVLAGAVSLLWTPDVAAGASRMAVVVVGMSSLALAVTAPKSFSVAREVRDAWSIALAATLPLAVYELVTGNHFAFAFDERMVGGDFGALPFASVFFGNFNDYCTFICLSLPMLLGTIESTERGLKRTLWIGAAVVIFAILLANLSRTAVAFALWLLIYYTISRRTWRKPVLLGLFVALAAFWVVGGAEQLEALYLFGTYKFAGIVDGDESGQERLEILMASMDSLRQTAGLGVGIGGIEVFLRDRYPNLIPNPHNLIAEVMANFGVLPGLVFCFFLLYLFWAALRSRLPADLRSPLVASLPFVPLIGVISSQAIGYTYWWLWFSTVTLVVASGQLMDGRRAPGRSNPFALKTSRTTA